MNRRTGLYFGYFTRETIVDGKSNFQFTTHNHPSLIEGFGIKATVVRNQTPRYFEINITVRHERENEIRTLIKQKTLMALRLNKDELVDIFDLVPRNITK